jgi:hypothetical protein
LVIVGKLGVCLSLLRNSLTLGAIIA